MEYRIFSENPKSNLIDIECKLSDIQKNTIEIQLPSWRPGRYELQNFAKNIQKFKVFDAENNRLKCYKIKKDRWIVECNGAKEIRLKYNYFSKIINAGSSFVDEKIMYINPVNVCVYAEGRIKEKCILKLETNDNQKIAGLIQNTDNQHFIFNDFYHLADSPFIVSSTLQHDSYMVRGTKFHLWFEGNIKLDLKKIKADFKKFTTEQINVFGKFPEKEYHFITWILPYAYYHGVEHRSSTMQVLGPDSQNFDELYIDLLGLASHELFHAWNICKIRPKELLPYNFTKENYFKTCFIAEGVTTYYGDLMLHRAGVFDDTQYRKELETYYKRHFDYSDNASQSLLESSFDLWLDGYSESIPNRKVSVYHKGAIAAQILDLHLQKISSGKHSIDDVMLKMWQKFGKSRSGNPVRGYSYEDYQQICEEVAGESLRWYFEKCIEGTESLFELLNEYLKDNNLQIKKIEIEGKHTTTLEII